MNYNYPQPQYQTPTGYGNIRPVPQYPQWTPSTSLGNQVRPVSSIEEVRACPIDFDGSVFYFTDMANRKIYTKQINLDGTATINTYELKEFVADQTINSSFVTKEEFDKTIFELKSLYETFIQKGSGEQFAAQQSKTSIPNF